MRKITKDQTIKLAKVISKLRQHDKGLLEHIMYGGRRLDIVELEISKQLSQVQNGR